MPVKVTKQGEKYVLTEKGGKRAKSSGTIVKAFDSKAAADRAARARNAATEGKKRK